MCDHECKCKQCRPEAFPEVSPRTPNYRSAARHPRSLHPEWVKVNGKIMDGVLEALSGERGWVIYTPLLPDREFAHRCECGRGICTDVKHGHVEFGPPQGIEERDLTGVRIDQLPSELSAKPNKTLAEITVEYRNLLQAIKEFGEKADLICVVPFEESNGWSSQQT